MQEVDSIAPGRRATITYEVSDNDTAAAMKSGDVPLLATPKVLALAEQAAVQALQGAMEQMNTSLGSWVEIHHLAPAAVGASIEVEAVLIGVHGRRLEFSIHLHDGDVEVARIKHRRVVVRRSKFED
jgi:predicted thioesterase